MKIRINNHYDLEKTVTAFRTEMPNDEAQFAMDLIKTHANVAGVEDLEDSQGRAKLRLQTPEELVDRSFRIAELAFAEMRARHLVVNLPDLNELNKEHDARREAKFQAERDAEAARKARA